ncbi:MAG: phospholipase D family protein [Steroidobacteraceae bacterium]
MFNLWPHANIGRSIEHSLTARIALVVIFAAAIAGCSTLPPGADFPKVGSVALAHPEETHVGGLFASAASEHGGDSGFRIISVGVDGFLARAQMIDAAERTLDLQYFIFRGDETGRLLTDALLRAADRGVRVRLLIDDGATNAGDEQALALDSHPAIEIRIFNPFVYRGHHKSLRSLEFLFNRSRLDYRMHNKLMVADNVVALVGGRNIGNQYFQMDPESQFADDDVFAAGPVAQRLSATFDEYWNSAFAIPAEALQGAKPKAAALAVHRTAPGPQLQPLKTGGIDYVGRLATGEPYAGMVSGKLPLVWTHAQVICDSPDKKNVESGERAGRLMTRLVATTARTVQSELLMVMPYFVPADEELQLLKDMRLRNARVRVLTNSLESSPDPAAHSGYERYRVPLLEDGVELYEVRSLLGNARGSGQTASMSRYGNYALHAKLIVFDRQKLFIGSMNFDQRSKRLNTEVGLIIDSAELARQTAVRFDGIAQPANSYVLAVRSNDAGGRPHLVWQTQEDSKPVAYTREPARSSWQRFKVWFMSLLPLDKEL